MSTPTVGTLPGAAHPLTRLLAALDAGACRSVADLASACDLPAHDVHAALTTLESVGRVRRVALLGTQCAPAGCGTCGLRKGCPVTTVTSVATLQTWQVVPR